MGYAEADRVRNIEGAGARLDHRLHHFTQEVDIGAAGVLGGGLDVRTKGPGQLDAVPRLLQALPPRNFELVLQMDIGGGKKGVNTGAGSAFEGLPGALNVARSSEER